MKVSINPDLCAGFGVCVGLSDEVFEIHDDGYGTVKVAEVPAELEDVVREAVSQCPANAISISE